MCVLFVAWQTRPDLPLAVAANRDEAFARPTAPADRWAERPDIVAGRDLRAGGTWMGATTAGRWAAVTNVRAPEWMNRTMPRSRGALVADFLAGTEPPDAFAARVQEAREAYAGFNLLVGDREALWYVDRSEDPPQRLAPGVYGLSNGRLGDPWPKVERGRQAFAAWLEENGPVDEALALLRDARPAPDDALPDTGVGLELERLLSPLFILGETYGTRSSTLYLAPETGPMRYVEQAYGPGGVAGGRQDLWIEP